jgi:hypothetical protein
MSYLDLNLQDYVKELVELRKESHEYSFSAKVDFKDKLEEFYNEFKKIAQDLEGYGNNVSIELEMVNGMGVCSTYVLELNPYSTGDDFLVCKDADDKDGKVCMVLNPDFENDYISSFNESHFYMAIQSFMFVQLYARRNELYNRMATQALMDIKRYINSERQFKKLMVEFSQKDEQN